MQLEISGSGVTGAEHNVWLVVTFGGTKTACSLEQNGALTYQRPVEEQRHPDERADAESQDEGPPSAPAQGAAVAGRADQRGEHEAEDGAEEPRQAVVLLGKTCTHKKKKTAFIGTGSGSGGIFCKDETENKLRFDRKVYLLSTRGGQVVTKQSKRSSCNWFQLDWTHCYVRQKKGCVWEKN